MRELVADMVHNDPSKRPTMSEVVARFDKIANGLSAWKLRSRIAEVTEPHITRVFRSVRHWSKQVGYMARRLPAIPKP